MQNGPVNLYRLWLECGMDPTRYSQALADLEKGEDDAPITPGADHRLPHTADSSSHDCTCPTGERSLGVLYGISFGRGEVRLEDDPDCPQHGCKKS